MTNKCADNCANQRKMYELAERFKEVTNSGVKNARSCSKTHQIWDDHCLLYEPSACGIWHCVRR